MPLASYVLPRLSASSFVITCIKTAQNDTADNVNILWNQIYAEKISNSWKASIQKQHQPQHASTTTALVYIVIIKQGVEKLLEKSNIWMSHSYDMYQKCR